MLVERDNSRPLRIFLCHSSGDKPVVRELYHRLRSDGFDPWLDEENLDAGQQWEKEIPKAVRDSDIVIVCLSHSSITKAGYVQKEIKFALDVAEEQPEDTVFLIPVKLEECNVPERLSQWQWVNLYEDQGYSRLFKSLRRRSNKIGSTGAIQLNQLPLPIVTTDRKDSYNLDPKLKGEIPYKEETIPKLFKRKFIIGLALIGALITLIYWSFIKDLSLMGRTSLFRASALPDWLGVALLSFSFILLLAPYFSSIDFGFFKILNSAESAKKWLKVIGPILFCLCIFSFVPILSTVNHLSANSSNSIGNTFTLTSTLTPTPSPQVEQTSSFTAPDSDVAKTSESAPIKKENLLRALEYNKNRRSTSTARFIELINQYGVNFKLTADDEKRIRQAGAYLSLTELDNLILAVRNNYREP